MAVKPPTYYPSFEFLIGARVRVFLQVAYAVDAVGDPRTSTTGVLLAVDPKGLVIDTTDDNRRIRREWHTWTNVLAVVGEPTAACSNELSTKPLR